MTAPEPAGTIDTDVAIVGGGLGGLPLGIACTRAGVSTVVIDRTAPDRMLDEPFDGRTTAIAFGSKRVLEGIGVWPALAADAQPILDIRVADAGSRLYVHYDHLDVGDQPLGWIVENRAFRRALVATAAALPDLVQLAPAGVEGFARVGERIHLNLADGRVVRARLAVGADGKRSPMRQWAGIGTAGTSYGQDAIICTVEHDRPHHGVAVEHFLPSGPFAILPLTGDRSSVVWTERSALVPGFMALEAADFEAQVARRFGDFLGRIRVVGARARYPLDIMMAHRITAPRLALVADAAHAMHPIAGQGWNLGIRDVAALAELIVDRCRLGLDPGADDVLRRYERWRRADIAVLLAATDGLNRLFSNDVRPIRLARELGLGLVQRLPPLKRLFMRHAMGTVGNLPRLVAGGAL